MYRARDTRLARDMAVKGLPDTLATDTERLARFEWTRVRSPLSTIRTSRARPAALR